LLTQGSIEARREAFLILDRANKQGIWETVAVSIVLPLKKEGASQFCRGKIATVNPDYESSGLTQYIVNAGDMADHFLYDTLIVKHKIGREGKLVAAREAVYKWQTALMFRHLDLLIDSPPRPIEILVEPDFWQIDLECEILDFNRVSKKLWSITYPNTKTSSAAQFFDTFWHNIEYARKWKVVNDESQRT
jgi:hypothetical protein